MREVILLRTLSPGQAHSTSSGQADPDDFFPTEEIFRQAQADPGLLPAALVDRVDKLAERHHFFHWHLEFPDVFPPLPGGEGPGVRAGFDVILGNPPWERIKLQEKEFFSDKDPAIANAANAAARRRAIVALQKNNPALWADYETALCDADSQSHFLHSSGRYPLTGRGDVNTYQVFAELARDLPGERGRAGVIVPTGIATITPTVTFLPIWWTTANSPACLILRIGVSSSLKWTAA